MAGLASRDRSIRARLLHALIELSFVRISVAAGATQILPVIDDRGLRLEVRRLLVAFGARSCDVPSGQHEACLFVLSQRERGRLVSLKSMAAFAGVEVWRFGELACMPVRMTIRAAFELHLKQGVLAVRDVTSRAFQTRMSTLQWICTRGMFLDRECGRLPSIHRMARSALSSVRTLGELTAVRIGLVAIGALLESQWLSKISAGVALGAIDAGMFPFEPELGL